MRLDPIFLHLYDASGKQGRYPNRYSQMRMRWAAVLIGIGGLVLLAGEVRFPAAQPVGQDSVPMPRAQEVSPPTAKLDINAAGIDELVRLPGVTLQVAEQIVRNRPYRKLDDLITRKVLGKKQFARIREFVSVNWDKP